MFRYRGVRLLLLAVSQASVINIGITFRWEYFAHIKFDVELCMGRRRRPWTFWVGITRLARNLIDPISSSAHRYIPFVAYHQSSSFVFSFRVWI